MNVYDRVALTDMMMISLFVNGVIFGSIGAAVGHRKGFGATTGAIFGIVLGIIGVIVLAVMKSEPSPPKGMRFIRCPRCNADQNVDDSAATAECWQCEQRMKLQPVA